MGTGCSEQTFAGGHENRDPSVTLHGLIHVAMMLGRI